MFRFTFLAIFAFLGFLTTNSEAQNYAIRLDSLKMNETGDSVGGEGELEPYISIIVPKSAGKNFDYKELAFKVIAAKYFNGADGVETTNPKPRWIPLSPSQSKDKSLFFAFGIWERDVTNWDTLLEDQVFEIFETTLPGVGQSRSFSKEFVGSGHNNIEAKFTVFNFESSQNSELTQWTLNNEDEELNFSRAQSALALHFFSDIEEETKRQIQIAHEELLNSVIDDTQEFIEWSRYYVSLNFKKTSYTLDLDKHLDNWLSSKEETIEVSEQTSNSMREGETLSSKFDWVGSLLEEDAPLSSYSVSVGKKSTQIQYIRVSKSLGKPVMMTPEEFRETLSAARKKKSDFIVESRFNGTGRFLVLEKALSDTKLAYSEPLKRYFVTLEIKNVTYTLDLIKHLRNSMLGHEIEIEVSEDQYNNSGEFWKPHFGFSPLVTGFFSQVRGKVVNRRMAIDRDYSLAITTTGEKIVLRNSDLGKLQK